MAILAPNIRTAITELLEGTIGITRFLETAIFSEGVWDEQLDSQKQAEILDTATSTYKFDVELGPLDRHPSTFLSVLGNKRLAILEIQIPVWGKLATEAERAQRKTDLGAMESALDDAIAVLSYPENLTETNASLPTNIISGCLVGPGGQGHAEYDEPEEDWDLKIVRSVIRCSAHLIVDQNPLLDYTAGTFTNSSGNRSIWHSNTYTGPFAANTVATKSIGGRTYAQIEGSQTNEVTYSAQADNAAWTKGNSAAVVADQATAPDGNTDADEMQFAADTDSRVLQQVSGLDDNTTYTNSVWHQLNGSNPSWRLIVLGKDTGTETATVTSTTSFLRADVSKDITTGASLPQHRMQNDTGGNAGEIDIWGMQMEAGAFPSSYIPTTSVAVTRAADSLSFGAQPGMLLGGKWKIRVIPYFADTDLAASENHYIAHLSNSDFLRLRKNSGGTTQLEWRTSGGNVSHTGFTWARYTALTITIDFVSGSLTVAGADTGNGTATGTVSGWTAGTLYIGSDATPGNQFDGLVSQPEAAA